MHFGSCASCPTDFISLITKFNPTGNAPSHHDCPFLGVWTTGEGECGGDVTHLRAGCSALYALKFVHACATQTTKHCEFWQKETRQNTSLIMQSISEYYCVNNSLFSHSIIETRSTCVLPSPPMANVAL